MFNKLFSNKAESLKKNYFELDTTLHLDCSDIQSAEGEFQFVTSNETLVNNEVYHIDEKAHTLTIKSLSKL